MPYRLRGQHRDDVRAIGVSGGASASGMGDVEIAPKLSLLDADAIGVDLAVLAGITLPTGDAEAFAGEEGLSLSPELAVSRRHGLLRWGANFGARLHRETRIGDQNIGSEFVTRVGAGLSSSMVGLPFEVAGSASYAAPVSAAELFVGLSADITDQLRAFVGGGGGVIPGLGAPGQRIALGLRYTHRPGASAAPAPSSVGSQPAPRADRRADDEEDLLGDDPIDPLDDLFADSSPRRNEPEGEPGAIVFEPDDLSVD